VSSSYFQHLKKSQHFLVGISILLLLFGCTAEKEIIGAKWSGSSDFMQITDKKMTMYYSSHIFSKEVFIGGLYEITRENTNEILNKIEVTSLEFAKRTDDTPYCRIWGKVNASEEQSYLLADNCFAIYQK